PGDVLLVARDRAGRHDHRIARLDLDEAVVAVGHPGQTGHRLPLGARGRDHQAARCDLVDPLLGDHLVLRILEGAELRGSPAVLLHRAPDDRDLPAERARGIDDLLDAHDVTRTGHYDVTYAERFSTISDHLTDMAHQF